MDSRELGAHPQGQCDHWRRVGRLGRVIRFHRGRRHRKTERETAIGLSRGVEEGEMMIKCLFGRLIIFQHDGAADDARLAC